MAIDIENSFEPEYIQVRGKADLIKTLKGASSASAGTLLASDPDREGEAIAWHLATLLDIDTNKQCRIRMHEITSHGVKSAIAEPDVINMNLVRGAAGAPRARPPRRLRAQPAALVQGAARPLRPGACSPSRCA